MSTSSSEKSAGKRCAWCHKSEDELKKITVVTRDRLALQLQEQVLLVHPRHEADVRAFCARYRHHGGHFVLAMLALVVSMQIGTLVLALAAGERMTLIFIGVLAALLGGLIIRFPFCTPETIRWLGLKRAVQITRIIGGLVVATGIVIAVL